MNNRSRRTVALAGLVGLMVGLLAALGIVATPDTYEAQTRLAIVPAESVPSSEIPGYWEVLSRGQANRTAAEVLAQPRWTGAASAEAGTAPVDVAVSAGAIPDTTLVDLVVQGPDPQATVRVAEAVVRLGTPVAQEVTGPFEIHTVQEAAGTVRNLAAPPVQVFVALAAAGLLFGLGAGLLVDRLYRGRWASRRDGPGFGDHPPAQPNPYWREPGAVRPRQAPGREPVDAPTTAMRNGSTPVGGNPARSDQ